MIEWFPLKFRLPLKAHSYGTVFLDHMLVCGNTSNITKTKGRNIKIKKEGDPQSERVIVGNRFGKKYKHKPKVMPGRL